MYPDGDPSTSIAICILRNLIFYNLCHDITIIYIVTIKCIKFIERSSRCLLIDDDPKLFYNRGNAYENRCLSSCSAIDVDEQCTVNRMIYGMPKLGRNSDHSATWEEWPLILIAEGKR